MEKSNKNLLETFNEAYSNLNAEQRSAVDTIEGPVMVIAGPGTGKTQILTLRIANILLKTDTRPENILALTFTDSGVRAMRSRLTSFIGSDAYSVPIHTFHSFAGELIRNYPDAYKNIVGGRPASELEKIHIIENLLEEKVYKQLRPHGDHRYYVGPILSAITTMKRENISPDRLAEANNAQAERLNQIEKIHSKGAHKGKVRGEYLEAEKFLERNQELLYIYQRYVSELRSSRLFDFEDMILDTIEALKTNEEMLLDVQEKYQYILADEHQDVNQSQNLLIKIVASYHEQPNVFVVGDEKQAIYRFQGASLENFLFFEDAYRSASIIALTNNYRSDQRILDAAHDLIATDDPKLKDLRVPLIANKALDAVLSRQVFAGRAIEDGWLIDQIKMHHEKGVKWSDMAVIVRTNKEIEHLARLMRKAEIPVAPSTDSDVLLHPIFLSLKKLLKVLINKTDEVALSEILQAPYWQIASGDLIQVFLARSYDNHLSEIIAEEDRLIEAGVKNPESVLRVHKVLTSARSLELTETPAQVLEFLINESGFLNYVLEQSIYDGVRVVRRFYDEIEFMYAKKDASNLKEVVKQFELLEQYKLPLTVPFIQTSSEAVNLLTAHKAKGLEFEVVMIPHLNDNVWGGSARSSLFQLPITKQIVDAKSAKAEAEDDERRLFYVAITRAKRVLECSYSLVNEEGRDLSPSRFLVELEEKIKNNEKVTEYESNFAPLSNLLPLPKSQVDADFLRLTLAKRGWSATSFNNFCKSPWEYIYKNALRIPTLKTPNLQFGTALHSVLENVVNTWSLQRTVSDSEVKKLLENALGKFPLTTAEFTRQHERGLTALMAYLPQLKNSLGHSVRTEYHIRATLETGIVDFPEVTLKGNFDRLDFSEDGRAIRVVDYKTGKAKTKGQIEGKTKGSDGRYKRQLVFYALLLSLQKDQNFHCKLGQLAFVEPDKKGILREEEFMITETEINDLKKAIIEATKAVITGSCLEIPCDPKVCEHCHLVQVFKA